MPRAPRLARLLTLPSGRPVVKVDVYVNVNYTRPLSTGFFKGEERTMRQDEITYSIAELSAAFSVTARTIRFYEHQGLLHPERQGQTRVYSTADRARLAWILRGKRVGFSLAEIGDMLDLYSRDDGRRLQRRVALKKCRERLSMLERQRSDIDLTIGELNEFCEEVEELLAAEKKEQVA